jgi:hypothetical protein
VRSGLGVGSGFGLGAGAGVGAGAVEGFGSGVGASRVAAVVESARVDHVGWCERGGRGRDGGDGEDAGGAAAEEGGERLAGPGSGDSVRDTRCRCSLFVSLAQPLADLAAADPPTPFANAL